MGHTSQARMRFRLLLFPMFSYGYVTEIKIRDSDPGEKYAARTERPQFLHGNPPFLENIDCVLLL